MKGKFPKLCVLYENCEILKEVLDKDGEEALAKIVENICMNDGLSDQVYKDTFLCPGLYEYNIIPDGK